MDNDNVTPTWEVVLRVEGRDVAVAAAFRRRNGDYDIGVGVEVERSVLAYADIIREAAFRVSIANNFQPVDRSSAEGPPKNETRSLPF